MSWDGFLRKKMIYFLFYSIAAEIKLEIIIHLILLKKLTTLRL